jgi:O-succinylbenzoate synthase
MGSGAGTSGRLRVEYRRYCRPFRQVLKTRHGEWRDRTGIILQLEDESGRVGLGEIAPIAWFGSETLEQAHRFCHHLPDAITPETIFSIPAALSACQFGFESAWEMLTQERNGVREQPVSAVPELPSSALLSAGEPALYQWLMLWQQGYRTFKWKIGVASLQDELQVFDQLRVALPSTARLRLDANGGLTMTEAQRWLDRCDRTCVVEYLEQPLPPDQFEAIQHLAATHSTPIALDESVATVPHLQACYDNGWRGIFVIKPAIAGSPSRLRQFCQHHAIDAVFSSVFETTIGRLAGLRLANELGNPNRATGYGTTHWFVEGDPENIAQ